MNNRLMGAYFNQLTHGCGSSACENEACKKYSESEKKHAVADAIVLSAKGPQALCYLSTLSQTESVLEIAQQCLDAEIDEETACEELIDHIEEVFNSDYFWSQIENTPTALVDPNKIAESFHNVVTSRPIVAEKFAKSLASSVEAVAKMKCGGGSAFAIAALASDVFINPANYNSVVLPLCRAIAELPESEHDKVIQLWRRAAVEHKRHLVQGLQQFVTLQFYTVEVGGGNTNMVHMLRHLRAPVTCLSLLYRANFGGDKTSLLPSPTKKSSSARIIGVANGATSSDGQFPGSSDSAGKSTPTPSTVATTPDVVVVPDLAYEEFYNDALNREVNLESDLARWLEDEPSFCEFPCVLTSASKARILQADAALQMRAALQTHMSFHSPYLMLEVSRDNIVEDCLQQLAPKSVFDLKMKLKVKFRGEDGIDEGGLAKEFFQVIMGQLFDRTFAMFNYFQGDRVYWFNGNTFEMPVKFELIGSLMGIALFNGVILNLHFPSALYKKLLGQPTTLQDLAGLHPDVARNLQRMLTYDEERLEAIEVTFDYQFEYFGAIKTVPLKPGGSGIAVTTANVKEYVELMTDYLLNKSVEKQFEALKRGFLRVTTGKPLKLFTPLELERAICGCQIYDFHQLERTTRYEDGFDRDHRVVKDFWAVVHELQLDQQKKVLMFATGSDRAPVEGLQGVSLVISRMGGDSKSLPTSHTCFNHLLLPEYPTKEDLKKALLLAINHATGFGLR